MSFEQVRQYIRMIETERLLLRKPTMDDANDMFFNWASDPEVSKYLTWPAHTHIEETKRIISLWLEQESHDDRKRFLIIDKANNEAIGCIDIVSFHEDGPEIGYCLARRYWNKGIMTEVVKAYIPYLFSFGYVCIHIAADENNIGSNRVIENVGLSLHIRNIKNIVQPLRVNL